MTFSIIILMLLSLHLSLNESKKSSNVGDIKTYCYLQKPNIIENITKSGKEISHFDISCINSFPTNENLTKRDGFIKCFFPKTYTPKFINVGAECIINDKKIYYCHYKKCKKTKIKNNNSHCIVLIFTCYDSLMEKYNYYKILRIFNINTTVKVSGVGVNENNLQSSEENVNSFIIYEYYQKILNDVVNYYDKIDLTLIYLQFCLYTLFLIIYSLNIIIHFFINQNGNINNLEDEEDEDN
uniref:6-cysteine protein n=1 Tax=Parastrongyloides trichosuri TaxID=131310 RepID=A0A0N4ZQ60_PARTI